ncbi:hypothetical protein [Hymenobacter rubripertinctus]|uniref:Uncharacterized protein n=1 Tax=Hymenobacter rubripertinctus TaxID=2029981 RepID=A0A418R3S6_9BACT|nr:hypothetical protein [Hymenobacter rubripertinctus]RIY12200.1 hypothetical protein D0T11_06060 [Hymenobacter rubripertinctus]
MKPRLLQGLLAMLLLTGCQSTHLPAVLPQTSAYGPSRQLPADTAPLWHAPTPEPVLSAALVDPAPEATAGTGAHRPSALPAAAPLPVWAVPRSVAPDTVLDRLLRPEVKLPADPLTTTVNVVGAVATVGGIVYATVGANNEFGGYSAAAQVLFGLALLAVGIPLLFFQGKNGRGRLRREAREKNVAPIAVLAARAEGGNEPLRKTGLGMALAGGVLLLLGLLGGTYGLILAGFIAVPLVVVGVILLVAGS